MTVKGGDLVMKFTKGQALNGEGVSLLDSSDSFVSDFTHGKFFEIESFTLGLAVEDQDSGSNALNTASLQRSSGAGGNGAGAKPSFAAWRDAKNKTLQQVSQISYPVRLEPFTFTKGMDKASPVLFQSCCNSVSFDSATLVKRKVAGENNQLLGFLRFDFSDVLIVGIDWSDDAEIKETCKFICRGVKVQYKRQNSDGSLGAASPATWSRDVALRGSGSS